MLEELDKTIESTCEWIKQQVQGTGISQQTPEMIEALAKLVEARASVVTNSQS